MSTDKKVYAAIAGITAHMAREGIGKDQKNQQQGYRYRGIDQVYAALSPALVEHKLCILPRVVDSSVVERQTQKGGTLIYTTLTVEFDFVSAEDGSTHTVRTVGEAMDSADKSSNKAMSAAYKYAAFMAFCIPTEGDNDADGTTYELAPERSSEPRVAPNSSPLLQDRVEKGGSLTVRLNETDPGASTMNARIVKELEVAASQGLAALGKAWLSAMPDIKRLPEKWELDLIDIKDVMKAKMEVKK